MSVHNQLSSCIYFGPRNCHSLGRPFFSPALCSVQRDLTAVISLPLSPKLPAFSHSLCPHSRTPATPHFRVLTMANTLLGTFFPQMSTQQAISLFSCLHLIPQAMLIHIPEFNHLSLSRPKPHFHHIFVLYNHLLIHNHLL